MNDVPPLPKRSCVVIGAGLAGLTAARELSAAGVRVTVLEKGRGVGGRMATRRVTLKDGREAVFDHGAQYFTARDAGFAETVNGWVAAGVAADWAHGFPLPDGKPKPDGVVRYRGNGGINAVPKAVAEGLDVRLNVRAAKLSAAGGRWTVETVDSAAEEDAKRAGGPRGSAPSAPTAETFTADALILTPPAPQSLALIESADGFALPEAVRAALRAIEYAPCIAVLAVLAGDSRIPPPGGQWMPGEPIAWIADNRRKGVSPAVTTVTLHAGPKFSRENYALGDEETAAQLISAAGDRLGSTVVKAYVHRWKFSLPTVTHPDRCLTVAGPPPVVFAGDAFGGPRVEGAALSGLAAAEAVADTLNRAGQVK